MNVTTAHQLAEPKYVPPDERRAHGKALREAVSREARGHWKPAKDRRDIVDLLNESNKDHRAFVKAIRQGRIKAAPED